MKSINKAQGLSLLEVVVAFAVFATILFAILNIFPTGILNTANNMNHSKSLYLAQGLLEKYELLYGQPNSSLTPVNQWVQFPNVSGYYYEVEVTPLIDHPELYFNTMIGPNGTSLPYSAGYRFTVSVGGPVSSPPPPYGSIVKLADIRTNENLGSISASSPGSQAGSITITADSICQDSSCSSFNISGNSKSADIIQTLTIQAAGNEIPLVSQELSNFTIFYYIPYSGFNDASWSNPACTNITSAELTDTQTACWYSGYSCYNDPHFHPPSPNAYTGTNMCSGWPNVPCGYSSSSPPYPSLNYGNMCGSCVNNDGSASCICYNSYALDNIVISGTVAPQNPPNPASAPTCGINPGYQAWETNKIIGIQEQTPGTWMITLLKPLLCSYNSSNVTIQSDVSVNPDIKP